MLPPKPRLLTVMEIVDQPLSRRGNRTVFLNRTGDGAVGIQQHAAVLDHPWNEWPALVRVFGDGLCGGKTLGVLLNALHAE